ncbi:Exported zinc metalloprotease YfgC precursor [hydrothermal vent metagenome]|uniref:Exported zinc metalloprotease YfgC n=1 Tax=hydrothermal vent metagenome TaxID=652676 RepID=A0A3B0WNF5_9ZZZZ
MLAQETALSYKRVVESLLFATLQLKMYSIKSFRSLLTFALFSLPVTSYAELPELGDPTQQEFTPYDEHLMGENFYRTIKASVPFVRDLEVNDYITNLGQKLISHSSQPDKKARIFVIKVANINAFAGPDANIGFHTGLIIAAKNESELAGVMAHEISHVTQRHLARAITGSGSNPVTLLATILAGILVASQNPQAGAAIIYGGTAARLQSQINFTRANEHEADRIGISVLRKSGVNPSGMASFFETLLQKSETNNVIAQMEYLRTHPLSTTRIAEARNRITKNDLHLPTDSLDFQFVRARLLVSLQKPAKTLIKQLEALKKEKINILSQYTLGLAYTSNKQTDKAIAILTKLSKKHNHPWIKLALADAYTRADKPFGAKKILENLNSLLPNYLPVSIRFAKNLVKLNKSQQAIIVLNSQLQTKKQSVVYNALAKAYFANGKTSSALEATSYEYELEGYINLAIQQINNALQQPNLKNLTIQRLESRKENLLSQISKQSRQQH